jgi:tetratricopeptide (TPR) repeat protein
MSNALIETALSYQRAGRFDEAERLYGEILRGSPRHVEALYLLGSLCFQRGNYQDALRRFDQVLQINPQLVERSRLRAPCFPVWAGTPKRWRLTTRPSRRGRITPDLEQSRQCLAGARPRRRGGAKLRSRARDYARFSAWLAQPRAALRRSGGWTMRCKPAKALQLRPISPMLAGLRGHFGPARTARGSCFRLHQRLA